MCRLSKHKYASTHFIPLSVKVAVRSEPLSSTRTKKMEKKRKDGKRTWHCRARTRSQVIHNIYRARYKKTNKKNTVVQFNIKQQINNFLYNDHYKWFGPLTVTLNTVCRSRWKMPYCLQNEWSYPSSSVDSHSGTKGKIIPGIVSPER